jgi:putative zinc-binding metallo-peptidase
MFDDLKARYHTEIMLPAEPFEFDSERGQYLTSIEGVPATSEELDWYIPLFVDELGLYPRLFVENTRLSRVILCGELFRSQKLNRAAKRAVDKARADSQPLVFEHKRCGGVPDRKHGILYLAVASERDDLDYMRELIHHEFYHLVQWQQFGHSGDREWAALNSPDFVYGPGGLAAVYGSDPTFWVMPAEEWGNGFLNQYSMSAPEEDQAEIFAHLLTKPARVYARLEADDILRRKVERLKASLKQFCRDTDEAFWQQVEESRLPFDH